GCSLRPWKERQGSRNDCHLQRKKEKGSLWKRRATRDSPRARNLAARRLRSQRNVLASAPQTRPRLISGVAIAISAFLCLPATSSFDSLFALIHPGGSIAFTAWRP